MIRKMILVMGCLVLASSLASAGTIEMICKNPRRSYQVLFDGSAKTFRVRSEGADTAYKVERIEHGKSGLIVRGKTVKDGPKFVAYLTEKNRIAFIEGGQIIQTDPCE